MYHYVKDKDFLNHARRSCSSIMKELENELRKKGMNTQYFLVGSGGKNMITQNGNEPIDYDYNLSIISCEDWNNCKKIKDMVRNTLNKVMRNNKLPDVDDSTSSLTSKKIHLVNYPDIEFSIDVCIVVENQDGTWDRLIHEKCRDFGYGYSDKFYWNTAPNSDSYSKKADKIKKVPGGWKKVREEYLKIKNKYLSNNEPKPSFICYIESVNNVYNNLNQKHIL